nr:AzlD domain-containing protein [Rhizobium sp. L1K21]
MWPYVFILVAGALATDMWRWMGVLAGRRLDENSELFIWVKATATALVAGVIAKQIIYPSGVLAASAVVLRVGAAGVGFAVFLATGKRMILGILAALAVLSAGLYFSGF